MRKWGEINTERENVTQLGRVSNAMQRNLMPWSSEWELHSSGVHLVTVTRKQSTLSIKRTVIFSQKLEHIFLRPYYCLFLCSIIFIMRVHGNIFGEKWS